MLWEEAGPQRGQEVRLPGQLSGGMWWWRQAGVGAANAMLLQKAGTGWGARGPGCAGGTCRGR